MKDATSDSLLSQFAEQSNDVDTTLPHLKQKSVAVTKNIKVLDYNQQR